MCRGGCGREHMLVAAGRAGSSATRQVQHTGRRRADHRVAGAAHSIHNATAAHCALNVAVTVTVQITCCLQLFLADAHVRGCGRCYGAGNCCCWRWCIDGGACLWRCGTNSGCIVQCTHSDHLAQTVQILGPHIAMQRLLQHLQIGYSAAGNVGAIVAAAAAAGHGLHQHGTIRGLLRLVVVVLLLLVCMYCMCMWMRWWWWGQSVLHHMMRTLRRNG